MGAVDWCGWAANRQWHQYCLLCYPCRQPQLLETATQVRCQLQPRLHVWVIIDDEANLVRRLSRKHGDLRAHRRVQLRPRWESVSVLDVCNVVNFAPPMRFQRQCEHVKALISSKHKSIRSEQARRYVLTRCHPTQPCKLCVWAYQLVCSKKHHSILSRGWECSWGFDTIYDSSA